VVAPGQVAILIPKDAGCSTRLSHAPLASAPYVVHRYRGSEELPSYPGDLSHFSLGGGDFQSPKKRAFSP
jgi:hypothetical protein